MEPSPFFTLDKIKNALDKKSSANNLKSGFLLAVSRGILPNAESRRKFKSPARTHRISLVWA